MKPFVVVGASEKARYDYAFDVARKNGFHFIPLNFNEAFHHEKDFYTSTLDSAKVLFYIADVDKWNYEKSSNFLKMINESPHRFILSTPVFSNYFTKKNSIIVVIGNFLTEITLGLKSLMTEPNRDLVRLALSNLNPIFLFHIIKKDVWKSPESLFALTEISRNIYKVKSDYILSLLAYCLPPRSFALSKKRRENNLEKGLIKKLNTAYPQYASSQIAEIYLMMKDLHLDLIELSDEEKDFLGFEKASVDKHMQEETFLKAVSLEEFL